MSSHDLEKRILVFLLDGPKRYSEISDVFVGAGEGRVSNQTLIDGLKRLEVEGKIRRYVQLDKPVVYSLSSVLEELTKRTFDGSLEIKIIAAISILFGINLLWVTGRFFPESIRVPTWEELLRLTSSVLPPGLLGLSFLVGGLGLWKLRRWSWYLLMAASIGYFIMVISLGPSALLLLLTPLSLQWIQWILLPLIIAAYLWYRRDILRC